MLRTQIEERSLLPKTECDGLNFRPPQRVRERAPDKASSGT